MKTEPRSCVLGGAMVVLELLAGMQSYVTSTVTPLLAADLGGQHLYGRAMSAVQAALFLALPMSPWLLRRWTGARVLQWLTPLAVLCSAAAAVAPTMQAYVAARFFGALTSGAMAGVGMGIIASQLQGRVRQFVLAVSSAMWVLSSLVGPGYAAWLSSALSWRWALVAYLPVLVAARWVIVRELRGKEALDTGSSSPPIVGALVLAASVVMLGLRPPVDVGGVMLAVASLAGVLVGARRILPATVFDAGSRGSPAAVRLLFWVSLAHYGADGIIAIVAHDLLGFDATGLGVLLMAGGLAWAVVGMVTGAWPAGSVRARWQLPLGLALVSVGLLEVAYACGGEADWLLGGWVTTNLGMGLVYLDCLNLAFAAPSADVGSADVGMAVVAVESLAGAVAGTLAASVVSGVPELAWLVFVAFAVLVLPGLAQVRLALPDPSASITA